MTKVAASAGASAQLRGRYLVRHPVLNAFLRATDFVLRLTRPLRLRSRPGPPGAAPRRLLIATGGHLGDAVLATGAIAAARRAFPTTEIGVVAPSWNAPVLAGHPAIARIHILDHWRANRSGARFTSRFRRYRETFRSARAEIAAAGYDAAVDTYPYFPNAGVLFWRAGIPWRVGFESGGFSELYSEALPWRPVHASALGADVVSVLSHATSRPSAAPSTPELIYDLPPVHPDLAAEVARRLAQLGVQPGYIIVHVGAGAPHKTWPASKWRSLLQALEQRGLQVLLTGAGAREAALASEAGAGVANCVNGVGLFAWSEFVAAMTAARLCVAPDTAAAHVAAAVRTPVVVLWAGINDPAQWRPIGSHVVVQQVACMPCNRKNGCPSMSCIRDIPVEDVLEAVQGRMEVSS